MTARLRIVAGGHELLLDSTQVQRVWTAGSRGDEAGAWERSDVPLLDLAALLRGDAPSEAARIVVIYGANAASAIGLAVDEVKGLVQLGAEAIAALPPLAALFALLFDGIAVEPVEGRHPLCLRAGLDVAALMAASVARQADGGGVAHG